MLQYLPGRAPVNQDLHGLFFEEALLEISYAADCIHVRLDAPVTSELDLGDLDPSDNRPVVIDCTGVKVITSLPLAGLIQLRQNAGGGREIRLLNVAGELRSLFERTGLAQWLD
ncbi:MAG: STAS domain-containing protein [Spirochaetales bacterium]|nr:STAS domain-containing protein [Leptospiraceae bacterium]MCP5480044.1 STAS domain-containing protein [Spirochaetales bacterium]MCP5485615.1 STAS domain-containing protein [Spirochaetales bacterium]